MAKNSNALDSPKHHRFEFLVNPNMNPTVSVSNPSWKAWVAALSVGGMIWGVHTALQAQASGAPAPAAKAALTVQVVQPQMASMPITLPAGGNVTAWQEASIGAEVQGLRLAELRADVGDRVEKGQVLAVLAQDMVKADLAQAEAAWAEAVAQSAQATADAQRARGLDGSGALSAQAVAQYATAEQTALARVAATEARVTTERLRLGHTEVRAPDAGVISSRSATVGAVPGSGSELFRLIRQGRLEWRAEVPFAELNRLKAGVRVALKTPGGADVEGTVRKVGPTVDAVTRNGLVYVDLPGPAGAQSGDALRAGMFVRGEFRLASRQVSTLPASALLLRDGFDVVMQVRDDQRVSPIKVRVLGRQGDRVAVDGVPPEAKLVARGGAFLADGDTVRVISDASK